MTKSNAGLAGTGRDFVHAGAVHAGAADDDRIRLIVGAYSSGGGGGLYPLTHRPVGDLWALGDPMPRIVNASFGVYSRRFGLFYLVDEQAEGSLGVYRGDDWDRVGRCPTGGADPCHAALDTDETCLAVANYGSGSLAFFRLDPTSGLPVGPPHVRANSGHGPDRDRQEGPHAHWVGFDPDRRWLYLVDLGADEVLAFPFDSRRGTIGEPMTAYRAPPGSGPRHLLFHPRLPKAFLVSELANSVTALDRAADGTLHAGQLLSSLPAGFAGDSQAGHIALNRSGDRLYVSNRGHDSIALFAVDGAGGLTLIEHVASGGSSPRFFLLLEARRRLVVANEQAGRLTMFEVAPDGRLARAGAGLEVPGAAFISASYPRKIRP